MEIHYPISVTIGSKYDISGVSFLQVERLSSQLHLNDGKMSVAFKWRSANREGITGGNSCEQTPRYIQ